MPDHQLEIKSGLIGMALGVGWIVVVTAIILHGPDFFSYSLVAQ
jgi:hypothetical protein